MQIVIGAIGLLSIAILGYLSWVLMKEKERMKGEVTLNE